MADANQIQQMLNAALEQQRAQMEAHVGAAIASAEERFRNLQAQNAAQQQAGEGLEAQLAQARAENVDLGERLRVATEHLQAAQERSAKIQAEALERLRKMQAEKLELQRQLSEALAGTTAPSGSSATASVDQKSLSQAFAEDKAPKYSGKLEEWVDWEFTFRHKLSLVTAAGDDALDFAEAAGAPETSPLTRDAVAGAGYTEVSRAVYTALTSCFPIGSGPLTYVRLHQSGRNGLAAWQLLKFTYRPRLLGNALVDKGRLRVLKEVAEVLIPTAIATYDLKVQEWEKQYSQKLEDSEKLLSLLTLMPHLERQGRLREMVTQGMQQNLSYMDLKAKVLDDL